jgi:hypothetical protein
MDTLPARYAARPDPHAAVTRPQLVAGAVAAKLKQVFPVDAPEPEGSAWDREIRAKLTEFERATRSQALSDLAEIDGRLL